MSKCFQNTSAAEASESGKTSSRMYGVYIVVCIILSLLLGEKENTGNVYHTVWIKGRTLSHENDFGKEGGKTLNNEQYLASFSYLD